MGVKSYRWTVEEREVLIEHSQPDNWMEAKEIQEKYMPHRTIRSIEDKRKEITGIKQVVKEMNIYLYGRREMNEYSK